MPTIAKCPICGHDLKVIGQKESMGMKFDITEECSNCARLEAEKIETKRLARVKAERLEMYDRLQSSNVGRKYYRHVFDSLEMVSESFKTAHDRAKKYCEVSNICKDKGYGIYFFGNNGRGKTALMACMIHELIRQGYECYLTNLSELGDDIINKRVDLDKIKKIDFLFLDDIGSERATKGDDNTWLNDKLYDLVSARDKEMLPTVFSSNVQIGDLIDMGVMKKTVERISSMATVKLEIITDNSYRMKKDEEIPF